MIRARSALMTVLAVGLLGAMAAPLQAQFVRHRSTPDLVSTGQPDMLATDPSAQGPGHVYVPPRYKFQQEATRPVGTHQGEAMVEMTCTVDVNGKPHDVTVTRSYGEKVYEKAAKDAWERSTFEPATLDGKPVEARFVDTLDFYDSPDWKRHNSTGASLADVTRGETTDFTDAYKAFKTALAAMDRPGADKALAKMDAGISNHYGAATLGLAQYQHAVLRGDQRQQLDAMRRAVTPDNAAQDFSYSETHFVGGGSEIFNRPFEHYLPLEVWKTGLLTCLDLEIKLHDYPEALKTWERLQKVGVKPEVLKKLAPMMDQLAALRTDNRPFDVTGTLADNGWSLNLYKSNFRIVSSGHIDQFELRCDTVDLSFKFDPEQEYKVNGKYGACQLQLTGTPGTQFTMTQF